MTLQFRYRQHTYLFTFKLFFSLFCLFFFCLCLLAGVWQLHRYDYKKNLLTLYQSHFTAQPKLFTEIVNSNEDLQFQSVRVQGEYVNALMMLIQNRYYQGKIGFEVLTPLRIQGEKKLLLIDRGWTNQPDTIAAVKDVQLILGRIKLLNEWQFTLGKNILAPNASPLVMQKIDIQELSNLTHQAYFPYILRLDAAQPHGFVRDWIVTTVLPQRHMGYAVQWFALAMVLFIAYFCFSCERVNHDHYTKK